MTDMTKIKLTINRLKALHEPKNSTEPDIQPAKASFAKVDGKRPTKSSLVQAMLVRDQGASLGEIGVVTGWLPHTCRAFLTGLRKKGKPIERRQEAGAKPTYHLAECQPVSIGAEAGTAEQVV